ncbi:class I mannose-6-phosphate isomerase [Cryobacterium tepidiphilum]|uniref:Mannose-6-phosphate isomerase n=1 Tax=Cryobacterium tepidiphilum TaxID=2486026 RepID=A0A3M8LPK9_9MICO|nr:class I mannose-6-phosphate isomerase [Cryobacterium tepidiphilum]RNE66759.1 mannose-6-phosphate isomerase [Cryobacterium tepidiphilum]
MVPNDSRSPASSYVKQPTIPLLPGARVFQGSKAWAEVHAVAAARAAGEFPVIVVDTYPGVDVPALRSVLVDALPEYAIVDVEDEAALPIERVDALIEQNLTDDRVFGVMSHARIDEFYSPQKLELVARRLERRTAPTILLGWGAALAAPERHALVLVDMSRWEIQLRMRAGAPNWRSHNADEDVLRKYKRGFFVEWRVADRHKRNLFEEIDFVVDGNANGSAAGMITGDAFRKALEAATTGPLRVVPFFDPGVWGGQWMKEKLNLDPSKQNYAWCFDCVPEENSLLLEADDGLVEVPAMDLVLMRPKELLGEKTFARFGAEFPIRFDFLDTMGGGNLSLQVHPLTGYIQDVFGMHYTQDESYYLLEASEDAVVYLGLKTGVDPDAMMSDLRAATTDTARPFPAEKYVNMIPAKKHDHFAIPAGTVHCSGSNSMVLEISATPFIFTFKLWDWGRVGLDGVPRPVHLEHGEKNIQWDRDTEWVERNLLDQVQQIARTPGVVEERTGLHELEFIEVRRHWFVDEASHDTEGTVNVLNLVEGDEVEVVSPTGAFAPYVVHYAETFIVPAAVGPYIIRRSAQARSERFATVKAYVRGTRNSDD